MLGLSRLRLVAQLLLVSVVAVAAQRAGEIEKDSRSSVERRIVVGAERRFALVVGNEAYSEAPLRNPRNDARAIAAVLTELGFHVTALENVGRAALVAGLTQFSNQLESGDVALFYFAGHGVQIEGENYLIPIDFKGRSATDVRLGSLSVNDIQREVQRPRVALIILDACRNNPFLGTRGSGTGLAPVEALGSLVAFSTGAGRTSGEEDSPDGHGLFTKELLSALRAPGLTVQALFKQVQRNVYTATQGAQFPAVYDGLIGDVVLRQMVASDIEPRSRKVVASSFTPASDVASLEASRFPILQGEVDIAVTERQKLLLNGEVVTTLRVKNLSNNGSIAGFRVTQVWYDKNGRVVDSAKVAFDRPISPTELVPVEFHLPSQGDKVRYQITFEHGNGAVKPATLQGN